MKVLVYKCPVCKGERFKVIEVNGTTDIDIDDLIFVCLECAGDFNIREIMSRESFFSEKMLVATRD